MTEHPLKSPCGHWGKSLLLLGWLAFSVIFAGCAPRKTIIQPAAREKFDEEDYRLIWPLPIETTARVTSNFGARKDPLSGMRNFHTGVDLDGEPGTPVHAAGAGEVVFSGVSGSFGRLLIVDHGKGLTTYYGHCSRLLRERGDKVNRGQVIALIGATGRTTGPHLHFEVRKHGRPFDPFSLLPSLRHI